MEDRIQNQPERSDAERHDRVARAVVVALVKRQKPRFLPLQVSAEAHFLIIHGERKMEQQENEGGVRRTERRYGEFYRAIALPEGADAQKTRDRSKYNPNDHPGPPIGGGGA